MSSTKPYDDIPTVEERLPEIRASAFLGGKRRFFATAVPMLASVGCPYACDFCVDWSNPYRQLSIERLTVDLRFLSEQLAGTPIGFHDPNFAVKFDAVLDAMEAVPPESRVPYMFETAPSILRAPRLERLEKTQCIAVVSGVESWSDYSNKAGVRREETGRKRIEKVLEHFQRVYEAVPYQQANFMVGLDTDEGREPVELTKEFISRTPYAWPALNIPVPFGGTPLFDRYLAEGRIHAAMPFAFYYSPYLVTTFKHYSPIEYYEMMIELTAHLASRRMLLRRLEISSHPLARVVYLARTIGARRAVRSYRRILGVLKADRSFLDFHEGRSKVLPDFYRREFDALVGPFAALLTESDRIPDLEQDCPVGASSSPSAAA